MLCILVFKPKTLVLSSDMRSEFFSFLPYTWTPSKLDQGNYMIRQGK